MVNIKLLRLSIIIGCLVFIFSACSSQSPENGDAKGDDAYQEWVQKIKTVFGDRSYILPDYDPNVGPLEMVYGISSTSYSLDLYRSDSYSIQKDLSGLHTVHDLYYSYSNSERKQLLEDTEILSRFGVEGEINRKEITKDQFILNNTLLEFQKENSDIKIYELKGSQDIQGRADTIIDFLKKKGIKLGQVLIFDLEDRRNLELYLAFDNSLQVISFTIQNLNELDKYLADLNIH
ncbi:MULTISPECIES: hypothetical protein [Paenibacillus]|uniref:hypothetical protein n=1 Tax=Paenibacillus TaxID=44249 RepID=UPI000B873E69|nr:MULTISPECIES: hypothetical protein [Paenibacillus]